MLVDHLLERLGWKVMNAEFLPAIGRVNPLECVADANARRVPDSRAIFGKEDLANLCANVVFLFLSPSARADGIMQGKRRRYRRLARSSRIAMVRTW